MEIKNLPHWALTANNAAFYDLESLTAIEQTARLYAKMAELIEAYNNFVTSTSKSFLEFQSGAITDYDLFTTGIRQEFADFIGKVDLIVMNQDGVIRAASAYMKENLRSSIAALFEELRKNGTFSSEAMKVFSDINREIAVLESRINNFVSLDEGSTTGDAELQDIRVGADGTVYESAGAAVRGQVSDLKSDLSKLYEASTNSADLWEQGGFSGSSGAELTTNQYIRTKDYLNVASIGTISRISPYVFSLYAWENDVYVGTYNSSKVFASGNPQDLTTINMTELAEQYPNYKFRIMVRCGSANIAPNEGVNLIFANPIFEHIGEVETAMNERIDEIESTINGNDETSILSLNKDMTPYVVQATAYRADVFGDANRPFGFIHLSDVHQNKIVWGRMVEYMNAFKEYLDFALHTGDYGGDNSQVYTDLYTGAGNELPILNCVGNHDAYVSDTDRSYADKATVKSHLFNSISDWGAVFPTTIANPMCYYKDIADAKVRLIVLDNYYDLTLQAEWLSGVLDDAKVNGYHVITASHEMTKTIVNKTDCTFQTLANFESQTGNDADTVFETVIANWKNNGGIHICHLCGHEHSDMFGTTENGVLNVVVESALPWTGWTDSARVKDTRTYDCFNIFAVDTNIGVLKIARIGANTDNLMRTKTSLCYDYLNEKLIYSN